MASSWMAAALQAPLLDIVSSTALLGASLHVLLFRTSFPVESYLLPLLSLHVLGVSSIAGAYAHWTSLPWPEILKRLAAGVLSFHAATALSMLVYRVFFHRLRRFPGPFWSKITRFYDLYLAGQNSQYHLVLEGLHREYGDFIRTGPRELCIVRASAVPLIYGPKSQCPKSIFYAQTTSNPDEGSLQMVRDFDEHRRRRRAWDRGFNVRALNTYLPRVKAKVDQLVAQIDSRHGDSLDATAWSMYLAFDIMGEVGFSRDFGNVANGVEHPGIAGIHAAMAFVSFVAHVPWLLRLIVLVERVPGLASPVAAFMEWCRRETTSKQESLDLSEYPRDIITWLLKAVAEHDASAVRSDTALQDDARLIIVAGSDTTSTTLANALYFLAKHPAVLSKLQRLLDDAMPARARDWSYEKLKAIPFLDDIIYETLRLRPPVMTSLYRTTPPQGIQVDEVSIPGDVNVFVPVQLVQMDERYYPQAKQFVPERWGERRDEMKTDEAPYFPFSLGPTGCPGKQLALMSLRISLSTLAQQFDISFARGETGERFMQETKDTFTTTLPPLQMEFRRRW